MTTWVTSRFRKEDTLGKMVLSAEIMGALAAVVALVATLIFRVL